MIFLAIALMGMIAFLIIAIWFAVASNNTSN